MRNVAPIALLSFAFAATVSAQTAQVTGFIKDSQEAAIPKAKVTIQNLDTDAERMATTNESGLYTVPFLQPGQYRISVSADGFQTAVRERVKLEVAQNARIDFTLKVGDVKQTVTVSAEPVMLDREDGTVGTVVDRRFVENIPLNGRSFQTLIQSTPGIVTTQTNYQEQGQFSVNGQRANANYFQVDGVSANVGIGAGASIGQTGGGAMPALSVAGGTNSLVSVDALQEFAIQTSTYAPEFGRMPGAQISITTRPGTNDLHGDAFDYLRNDIFNANNWFANSNGLTKPRLRQNDFGGVLGGPILKNKLFYFGSYEGLRLRQPITALTAVPSSASRAAATQSALSIMNAFPLPTGADLGNGLALANKTFSNPSTLDAGSIRIDAHLASRVHIFGRYNESASQLSSRGGNGFQSLNTILVLPFRTRTLTLGATYSPTGSANNDLRLNWSHSSSSTTYMEDSFGGAQPLSLSSFLPGGVAQADTNFMTRINSGAAQQAALLIGPNARNLQEQINIIDIGSIQYKQHLFRIGVDYRHLAPEVNAPNYVQNAFFNTVSSLLSQNADLTQVQAFAAPVRLSYDNYSVFAQDTWKVSRNLTITYGIRWDFNPAPSIQGAQRLVPFALSGLDDPRNLTLAAIAIKPKGTPLYHATRDNFAPRLGAAFRLRSDQRFESVVRGGVGIFYDLGNGTAGNAASFAPFRAQRTFSSPTPFPLTPSQAAPPDIATFLPYNTIWGFPSVLRQPQTEQWNLSYEQALGSSQSLTVAYIGALGHRLLRQDVLQGNGLPSNIVLVNYTNNLGYSSYNALQAKFYRNVSRGIHALVSYTYGHSLDNVSVDSASQTSSILVNANQDYSHSDFDIRHTGTVLITYEIGRNHKGWAASHLLGGFAIDGLFLARTAPPVNVTVLRTVNGAMFYYRPDLLPDVPLYTYGSSIPGGRQFNRAQGGPLTFGPLAIPAEVRQGTLGRNFFRAFPLVQQDIAIRRNFALAERFNLQVRLEAFNVFNHPNFASESGYMGQVAGAQLSGGLQSTFGRSQAMLSSGLAPLASTGAGFNPLYQLGGPRSLQIALKVIF